MHRFYIEPGSRELRQELWIDDIDTVAEWKDTYGLNMGDELVLFDGISHNKLYRVMKVTDSSYELAHITDVEPMAPGPHIYLFWHLSYQASDEVVLAEGTSIGVSNFIPLTTGNETSKQEFDLNQAKVALVRATEQSGRSKIPLITKPVSLVEALAEHDKLTKYYTNEKKLTEVKMPNGTEFGVFVGPKSGWTEAELKLLKDHGCQDLS